MTDSYTVTPTPSPGYTVPPPTSHPTTTTTAPPPKPPHLADTGASDGMLGWAGAGVLLVLGGALVVAMVRALRPTPDPQTQSDWDALSKSDHRPKDMR